MRGWGLGLVLVLAGGLAIGLATLGAGRAHACGGLFCNAVQPVNQAAERILFVENGDGTVTAVIEIQYQGPSASFSWVLPVPGVPEVAVSSTMAFDRLQGATNPFYMLQTTFEQCGPATGGFGGAQSFPGAGGSAGAGMVPPVVVLAAGTVGPFDYEVISLDSALPNPADVAIQWLETNGYEVTALAPDVLGPYLENGLNLLAFRLNKQSDSGSIRPIRITYASDLPFIPIRPTAVAALDDMGVMVWVVASARAVPDNYKALELNEALINWFNPMSTYNDVVSAAADEAEGQGFVTELAAPSSQLDQVVFADGDLQNWQRMANQLYPNPIDFLLESSNYYGQWDGFQDALAMSLTLPAGVEVGDVLRCPNCYVNDPGFMFNQDTFRRAVYEQVIRPMAQTQELIDSRPYVTRLYTTLSADEMTLDPAFNFNSDLPDLSNIHTAQQTIQCNGGFRVLLADGTTVYGQQQGTWPVQIGGEHPAARKIMQLGTTGEGRVVLDNSDRIAELLAADRPATPPPGGRGGTGGSGGIGARAGSGGRAGSGLAGRTGGTPDAGVDNPDEPAVTNSDGCHCSAALGSASTSARGGSTLALLALGLLLGRKARRRR